MSYIFLEITVVLVIATLLGMVAKWLKQPTILGYIAAGLIVGPLGLLQLDNVEVIDAMAQIGITLLLFMVGMEIRLSELRSVGKPAVVTGLGQIVFTAAFGWLIARALGYAALPALYAATALTFSSTIIVVKLLTEKNSLETLHGKIVVGFLLIQDFVALVALILITAVGSESGATVPIDLLVLTLVRGALLFAAALLAGRYLLPRMLRLVAHSQELLFLASLAWGMGVAALVTVPWIGFSIEIGGFLAGIAMAGALEHFQIASRVRSLRDFFIVMFFVALGSRVVLGHLGAIWAPTVVFSLFVLIGNPLIVMAIMGALGYRSRTSFLASVTVAQISEFSFILMALGHRLGHVDEAAVSVITAVGIITITASSYMIIYGERLYEALRPLLRVFERRRAAREDAAPDHELRDHVILVGANRTGHAIIRSLERGHEDFLVVDFNPAVVHRLLGRGVRAVYGDITDTDMAEKADVARARAVISTPDAYETSLQLLHAVRRANPSAKVVLTAVNDHDARELYAAGADYVLVPHFVGGMQIAHLLTADPTLGKLASLKARDLGTIGERIP
jgi:Kef-type K+ transport system membrane component KefB